ncbi:uncharacterized protein LOC109821828 [Asparagus officinalis]|uniref:uncharacterized protein LOC109821828 n=1 Tax=Asparagus officinalis TaxID=4686 RepID=UPI00098E5C5F|nr:uncharacterized protein LOC109821828 [Asparagus officinalis]
MRNQGEELDYKEKLVREICAISTLFTSCSHNRSSTQKPGFIDWYLILRIDEDSGSDMIRKRYRQLELQLHPDKNRHPKAEVAFKLISEAYECLSDEARRKTFNSERKINFCKDCHRKSQQSTSKKNHKDAPRTKQNKFLRALKEVQNKLKEECKVIENSLRVKEASRDMGSPLFDPSHRLQFPDYPHYREKMHANCRSEDYQYFRNCSTLSDYRKMRCESPVYELRSESRRGWSRRPGFRFCFFFFFFFLNFTALARKFSGFQQLFVAKEELYRNGKVDINEGLFFIFEFELWSSKLKIQTAGCDYL